MVLLGILIATGLLWWRYAKADNELTSSAYYIAEIYSPQTIIFNNPSIPNEADWEEFERKRQAFEARQRANKKAGNGFGRWGCVRFAKAVTGVYGTWGDGGRKLSLNSDGQIGDVVIFTYTHVAVVADRQGDTITIREWITTKFSAYERTITMSIKDPTIKGFHKFK